MKPSATAGFLQKVVDLRARGVEVLGFGVGEPDFPTPAHIVEATTRAMVAGNTRYTSVRGVAPLRRAIARDSSARRGGITHEENEIVVSVGAKHALFNLCFALLQPGDEAIVPTPCWVSYPEQAQLAGATPVLVETLPEHGYKLTAAGLRAAITERTRVLFLCSPNNPTGAAYSEAELAALADVLRERPIWIVVDEIYSALVYHGFKQRSLLEVAPDLRARIVIVDGVSKRFAMTGFRIGWLLAPREVAAACDTLQSQATTNPATPMQYAALAALEGPQDVVETMRLAFERRRDLVLDAIAGIPGVACTPPDGAFYAFLDVRAQLGRTRAGVHIDDDVALAEQLLEAKRVAVVPGSAFCAPGHLRLSYAASEADLREGLARIEAFLG
ncbi:MAG TPA: pyridoxal phosphate-dependent aminotransferase [Polyangiales bacterium]|nr:pyridoxal phosphate-dependent aminotransferase [Polyangiales bacterium]